MAYLAGILGGMALAYPKLRALKLSKDAIWDFTTFLILGMLLGGRLGYVLIYDFGYFFSNPAEIFAFWKGGMSFHGAALGCVGAVIWFSKKNKITAWSMLDLLGWASPLGIGLGRIANFINGELVGRVTTVPWGIVFPDAGPLPRHPSQLYEALGEGLILFILLSIAMRNLRLKNGQLFGLFMMGYGGIRLGIEFFREPDIQVGYFFGALTMGQILSVLMVVLGVVCYRLRSVKHS